MWFVSPLLSFPGNYMMINEAVFYQSNATLAQNINQLFSPRHFTGILLSQFFLQIETGPFHSQPSDTSGEFYLQMICQRMFCSNKQVGFESLRLKTTFLFIKGTTQVQYFRMV